MRQRGPLASRDSVKTWHVSSSEVGPQMVEEPMFWHRLPWKHSRKPQEVARVRSFRTPFFSNISTNRGRRGFWSAQAGLQIYFLSNDVYCALYFYRLDARVRALVGPTTTRRGLFDTEEDIEHVILNIIRWDLIYIFAVLSEIKIILLLKCYTGSLSQYYEYK